MEESLEARISQLKEREAFDLEQKQVALDKRYDAILRQLERLSELTGISHANCLRYAVRASQLRVDTPIYDVLDILLSFFIARRNDEQKEE